MALLDSGHAESGFRTAKVVREGKGRETKQPKSEIHDDRSQRTGFDEYMRCGNFLSGEASFIFEIGRVEEWRPTRRFDLSVAPRFRLPLPVYPLSQVLQIAERFYQTPLPPIIARGVTKQLGSFAPWELPQFIATLNPSDTFSPSFLFPVQPVIGRTCSRAFRSGTRKVSPVA